VRKEARLRAWVLLKKEGPGKREGEPRLPSSLIVPLNEHIFTFYHFDTSQPWRQVLKKHHSPKEEKVSTQEQAFIYLQL
jgi:hypothetical protein